MPTRRLKTKELYNARDLGGYPTKDGRTTRFGVFVRSEAPVGLPEEDIQYLKDYGVTASIDLRSEGETRVRPSDLRERLPYYPRSLFHEAAIPGAGGGKPEKGPGGPPPMGMNWGEQYINMAETSRDWALDVLDIAAKNNGALLYHCTTGKDRTGLLTCYLLSICGVDTRDIAADYCISQVYLEPVYERMRSGAINVGPGPEDEDKKRPGPMMDEGFFKTPAEAMLTLIRYLTENYGGVVEYLKKIGVSEETMKAIRTKLIED